MFKELFNEYRPVSYLVLMQAVVIVFGTLATGTMLKVWKTAVAEGSAVYNPLSLVVRDFGFLMFLVPAFWVACVLYRPRLNLTNTMDLPVGFGLLVLLFAFFCHTSLLAGTFHVLTVAR